MPPLFIAATALIGHQRARCIRNCLLLFLVASTAASAQPIRDRDGSRAPINFQRLSPEDGLSQAVVQAIVQDRRGFMWFGTQDGLNRFDGYSFEVFKPEAYDSTTLPSGHITGIHEDRDGTFWIATLGGLGRMEPSTGRVRRYVNIPGDPPNSSGRFWAVHRDRAGNVWVGTFNAGLIRLDPRTGRATRFRHDAGKSNNLSHDRIFAIFEDGSGHLWIGTNNGVSRLDPDTGVFIRYFYEDGRSAVAEPRLGDNAFTSILSDSNNPNVLWFGSARGLIRLDVARGGHTVHIPDRLGMSPFLIRCLIRDPIDPSVLWLGTIGNSLYRFDTRTESFEVHSSIGNDVESLYADRTGWIWVGVDGGVSRFHPELSRVFRHVRVDSNDANSLSEARIAAIAEDEKGALWIGTMTQYAHAGVLNRIDRKTGILTRFRNKPNDSKSLSAGAVTAIVVDREGALWTGAGGTLNRMDLNRPGLFTRFHHDPENPESRRTGGIRINVLHAGHSDVLWIGTSTGLARMDLKHPGHYAHICGVPARSDCPIDGRVFSIIEDHAGAVWVGSFTGVLAKLDQDGKLVRLYQHHARNPNSLASPEVNALHERAREPGIIWIASPAGLSRLDTQTDTFTHFAEKAGLANDHIHGILEDDDGRLWVSTNGGLARFDPETNSFKNFDENDGLIQMDYNQGPFLKSRNGELLFGGLAGIDRFFPAELRTNTIRPQIVFTDVLLDHRSVPVEERSPLSTPLLEAENLRIPPGHKSLTFEFAALHYQNPARNQYAFRLKGFDEDWVQAGTRRSATYTNLAPGDYTLLVKGSNADGVWNEEGISMGVTILSPWWRTMWAYAAYGLILLMSIVLSARAQRLRLIRTERAQAAVREAELRAEALEADNRRKELELDKARELEAMNARLRVHEEELEKQNARLAELDKLKSRFFANISHEIRTPLTLILGPLAEALEGADSERLLRHVPFMHRSATRLLDLIGQLLDLASLDAGGMQLCARRTDLVRFLREMVFAFGARAEQSQLRLLFDTREEELYAYVDRDKLEKIVANLLLNAIKFTDAGGKVRLELGRLGVGSEGVAELKVEDTGIGIPEEELSRIFNRFQQVDGSSTRIHQGVGLGLALAKELVTLHQGAIHVASKRGFGSTFTIRLPLGSAHLTPAELGGDGEDDGPASWLVNLPDLVQDLEEAPERIDADIDGEHARALVLVVEDNDDMRTYLKSLLCVDYRILEARDGVAALEIARRVKPDLILSDLMMPGMDGYGLCQALKADEAVGHVPVVLLTARADDESRLEGLGHGADDYLQKPFSAAELMLRVENLIQVRRRLRDRFSREIVLSPSKVVVSSMDAEFLECVRDVVETHLGDSNFGVGWLADELAISRRHLARRLKATVGLSPGGYLRLYRLERAAQLLEQKSGTVQEISYRVGFKDAYHFSKLFRQAFGVLPSSYPTERT